jgi:bacillolysin
VIAPLLLCAALGQAGMAGFKADFPAAETAEPASGGRLTHASGFQARGLGETAEAAARAFLGRYGTAFGVGPRQVLVLDGVPAAGQPGAVRFTRTIDGLPLFGGDVVVGVDAERSVMLVNVGDVPAETTGRARISQKSAVKSAKAAIPGLKTADTPRAEKGWRSDGKVVRPAWRVDFTATKPPGDWRSYVDAETGKVMLRVDLRVSGGR